MTTGRNVMVDTYPAAVATVTFPESVPLGARIVRGAWTATTRASGRLFRRIALQVVRAMG